MCVPIVLLTNINSMENQKTSPKKENVQGQDNQTDHQMPKQDLPPSHLPDPKPEDEPDESIEDEQKDKLDKPTGNGFDEWSVSWP